jgi:hypothetical protein
LDGLEMVEGWKNYKGVGQKFVRHQRL